MKKKKTAKSAPKKKGLQVINVKVSASDRRKLLANAERYAAGNLSAWLRHAGQRYAPKRGELIRLNVKLS